MNSATSPSSADPAPSASRESCAICLETPVTYGLLVHCDHVFCLGMGEDMFLPAACSLTCHLRYFPLRGV